MSSNLPGSPSASCRHLRFSQHTSEVYSGIHLCLPREDDVTGKRTSLGRCQH